MSFDGQSDALQASRLFPDPRFSGAGLFTWRQWVCSSGKLVVSRAGEAYDSRVRGPNRRFRGSMFSESKLIHDCMVLSPRTFGR